MKKFELDGTTYFVSTHNVNNGDYLCIRIGDEINGEIPRNQKKDFKKIYWAKL